MKRFAAEISLGLATAAGIMVVWGWAHGQPSTLFHNMVLWIGMAVFSMTERSRFKRARSESPEPGLSHEVARTSPREDEEIRRLLLAGQKIAAIKLHRERHGGTLRQAVDYVNAIEARGGRIQN